MIFPEDIEEENTAEDELPVYTDWAFDFENNRLKRKNAVPFLVEGEEALKFWIYKALNTLKGSYKAYSDEFGIDFRELIGETDREIIEAELERLITEALTVSPYISDVTDFEFNFEGGRVTCSFAVDTEYGVLDEEVDYELL